MVILGTAYGRREAYDIGSIKVEFIGGLVTVIARSPNERQLHPIRLELTPNAAIGLIGGLNEALGAGHVQDS